MAKPTVNADRPIAAQLGTLRAARYALRRPVTFTLSLNSSANSGSTFGRSTWVYIRRPLWLTSSKNSAHKLEN